MTFVFYKIDSGNIVFTIEAESYPAHLVSETTGVIETTEGVIPPFLTGCIRRIHAAIFSFWAGVMPPIPMFGRSLL